MVLKQQWLANKPDTQYTLFSETEDHDNSLGELTYGPKAPGRNRTEGTFYGKSYGINMQSDSPKICMSPAIQNVIDFHELPLNPRDGNLCFEKNHLWDMRNGEPWSMSNVNRENIKPFASQSGALQTCLAPLSCSNQLMERSYGGIIHDHFRVSNMRIDISNRQNNNITEMGAYQNVPWDGRLRPNLNILKQGRTIRLNCPYNHVSGHSPCYGEKSFFSHDLTENPLFHVNEKFREPSDQATCKNFLGVPIKHNHFYHDIKKESFMMHPHKDLSSFSNSPCTEIGVNSLTNHQKGSAHLRVGIDSSLDLSFRNLSPSSSTEVESPASSSPTTIDVPEALEPFSEPSQVVEEEVIQDKKVSEKPILKTSI